MIKRRKILGILLLILSLAALLAVAIILNNRVQNENTTTEISKAIEIDNGDQKINWERFPLNEIELSESYSITSSGIYHFTGELTDGLITVNVRNGDVKLILDNVSIKNSNGPAIACLEADDLVIELIGENTVEDGATYSSEYNEDVASVIYSKGDLTFQGQGELTVTANYQDGIVSKDDLKFYSGKYDILSVDDGIRGKDSVYIVGGEFAITSGSDAIKSTNETQLGKGFILVESGNFDIDASAKAIKAVNSILLYGGDYTIKSYDDAIHSDNYIGIVDGNIEINSGDDGIHANKKIIVDGGSINIDKAYEGIESQSITINNGNISLKTFDDGINAGGGADASSNNRPGANMFDIDEDCIISVNGGDIYINSSGDGVDSNGYVYFNGGQVTIDGPTSNGNGALDAGGGITMVGGKVIAIGSSGMAVTLGNDSSIFNLSIFLESEQPAGTIIDIQNAEGDTIISHISAKTFNHMAIGSEQFELGEDYILLINGQEYQTFTITDITTTIGNNNKNFNIPFRR